VDSLIKLDLTDLVWGLGMIAIAIGISSWQRLGLELPLAHATLRTVVQLLGVGYILAIIFELKNAIAVLGVLMVMLTIATITARNRIGKKIPQLLFVVFGSIFFSTALTLTYTNLLIIQPETWYEPQY
jgi:putative ABC transport system permease protein